MSKYLIVNSDDFGISAEVSRGIMDAHHNGIITSTTCMINMPAAEFAIQQAQQSASKLGIGLHFVLSFGKPVSPPDTVSSLVTDDGSFVSTYHDLMAKMPSFRAEDLERELTAQFERFRSVSGRLPSHLDSHHGSTYYNAVAFDVMLRLAKTHNLPIRWVPDVMGRYNPRTADKSVFDQIAASLEKHGLPRRTDHFVDFTFDFKSGSRVKRLKDGLMTIQDGYTEMVMHVGYGKELAEDYNFQRNEELEAATDADVKQIIMEQGIQLINYHDLP